MRVLDSLLQFQGLSLQEVRLPGALPEEGEPVVLKRFLCRLFGHRQFVCHYCKIAMIGLVRGISVRPCANPDRHDNCGRCGVALQ